MNNEEKSERIRLFDEEFHEVTPDQLEQYLSEHKVETFKHRKRNQYHQLALMAKIDRHTTEMDLEKLLNNDIRTLMVQKNRNKPQDLEQLFLKINTCVDRFYGEGLHRAPIGLAVEINGELLTTGRMRNDESVSVEQGQIMILTNNEEYKSCCFKEVVYVSNLWRYSEIMDLGDLVVIGKKGDIITEVVKCGSMRPLTVKVIKSGVLTSYMNLKLPYYIEGNELHQKDIADIDEAIKQGAHFVMIPGIRSLSFLRSIKQYCGDNNIRLIGSLDFKFMESKFIDFGDHLIELEGVAIENMFCPGSRKQLESIITQCKNLEKALIGSVPLKACSDFKKLENHMRIKQMDCLLIEKSPLRMKFPLIAKKLLPVDNHGLHIPSFDSLSCKDGIINFVLRTIYSMPCQAIVITNSCPMAAVAFSNYQIYCPVIVVVESDEMSRALNLRKNLKTIVCQEKTSAMDVGIEFGRKEGIFTDGDFIISISETMEENSQICVNLQAYFLPEKLNQ